MHKKFEINQTKIKGGCQSGRKVVTRDSKSDLPLVAKSVATAMVVQCTVTTTIRATIYHIETFLFDLIVMYYIYLCQ